MIRRWSSGPLEDEGLISANYLAFPNLRAYQWLWGHGCQGHFDREIMLHPAELLKGFCFFEGRGR